MNMPSIESRIAALESRLRRPPTLPRVFVALSGNEVEVTAEWEAAIAAQAVGDPPHVLVHFSRLDGEQ
jgi:hypothetical protein